MQNYIRENAAKIAELIELRDRIYSRDGYAAGFYLDGVNRDFAQGVQIATRYPFDFERGGLIWRGTDGSAECPQGDAEILELLNSVFGDEQLFDAVKMGRKSYDGRIQWEIDECVRGFDFENYEDAYYTEYKIILNPATGRVSTTKPREYSRSVLVAMNID